MMPLFGRPSWLLLPALTASEHTTAPVVRLSILFWLDNLLSAHVGEYHIKDGKQQGLMLRQLVEVTQLTRKIAELPALRCAANRGEATSADYAAALIMIACADPDDALACHSVTL